MSAQQSVSGRHTSTHGGFLTGKEEQSNAQSLSDPRRLRQCWGEAENSGIIGNSFPHHQCRQQSTDVRLVLGRDEAIIKLDAHTRTYEYAGLAGYNVSRANHTEIYTNLSWKEAGGNCSGRNSCCVLASGSRRKRDPVLPSFRFLPEQAISPSFSLLTTGL
jgi:hypothetical protein